eukprot:361782-Amphidinium_carterae.1
MKRQNCKTGSCKLPTELRFATDAANLPLAMPHDSQREPTAGLAGLDAASHYQHPGQQCEFEFALLSMCCDMRPQSTLRNRWSEAPCSTELNSNAFTSQKRMQPGGRLPVGQRGREMRALWWGLAHPPYTTAACDKT